jgi:hypothetical protein
VTKELVAHPNNIDINKFDCSCQDMLVCMFCHPCALTQEYRSMAEGPDDAGPEAVQMD